MTDELQGDEFDIYKLTPAELEKVPFEFVKWQCKIKFCKCFTRLRDYGMDPVYYHKRGVTGDDKVLRNWINVRERFFICAKHWKRFKGRPVELVPWKRTKTGGIPWGYDDTGKETIIL